LFRVDDPVLASTSQQECSGHHRVAGAFFDRRGPAANNQAPHCVLSLDVAMPIWPLYAFAASTAFAVAAILSLVLG
jgi:hypothetical protein